MAWLLNVNALLPHLQHTPTLIEAYVAKAKFLKHAGQRGVFTGQPAIQARMRHVQHAAGVLGHLGGHTLGCQRVPAHLTHPT